MVIEFITLKCLRCGNEWVPRKQEVKACPACKSRNWNQKRVNENGK